MGGAVAHRIGLVAGHLVACVQQAQGVVGALDEGSQADKAKGVVAHDGAVGGATKQMGALLDPFAEAVHAIGTEALAGDLVDVQPGGIDVSHMSAVIRPRTAWAQARADPRQL